MIKAKPKVDAINGWARMLWLARHSALSYANQWFTTDRRFMQELKVPGSGDINPDVLEELAAKYMVARGFKKGSTKLASERRWTSAAAHLKRFSTSAGPICDEVHALAEKLANVAPVDEKKKKLISAATKFLWFSGNHDVRILDKRAVAALNRLKGKRVLTGDYSSFASAWQEQFDAHKCEIEGAVAQLPDRLEWTCIDPKFYDEAMTTFQTPWFTDRVFDKYLWTIGASEARAATSFV